MRYNTGNPVGTDGSSDPRDLYDNAGVIDVYVNSDQLKAKNRLGEDRLTLAGMNSAAGDATIAIEAAQESLTHAQESQVSADKSAASAAQAASSAAIVDATNIQNYVAQAGAYASQAQLAAASAGVFATTTAGLAGTTEGQYFSVPSSSDAEYMVLYRNVAAAAQEVKRYPSALAVERVRISTGEKLGTLDYATLAQVFNGAEFAYSGGQIVGLNIPSGNMGNTSYVVHFITLDPAARIRLAGSTIRLKLVAQATANFLPAKVSTSFFAQVTRAGVGTSVGTLAKNSQTGTEFVREVTYTVTAADERIGIAIQIQGGSGTAGHLYRAASLSFSIDTWAGTTTNASDYLIEQKLPGYTRKVLVKPDGTGDNLTPLAANTDIANPGRTREYDILVGAGVYTDQDWFLKSYVNLVGHDRKNSIIRGELPDNVNPSSIETVETLWVNGNSKLKNMTITARNMRYPVHSDASGANKDTTIEVENCHIEHLGNEGAKTWQANNGGSPSLVWPFTTAWGFGSASGLVFKATRSTFKSDTVAWYVHTNGYFDRPNINTLDNCECIATNPDGKAIRVQPLGSMRNDIVQVNNSLLVGDIDYIPSPWVPTALSDQPANHAEIELLGSGNSPAVFTVTDWGRALKIESALTGSTSSVAVSGTAATVLFGKESYSVAGAPSMKGYVYGWADISGHGVGLQSNVFITSLGQRLGDCTTVNKTLTVSVNGGAGVNVVFNQNYTSATNAAVLAAINAVLGASATASEYAIGERYRPKFSDEEQILKNVSTDGIQMGCAVAYSGSNKQIRKMTSTDPAFMFAGIAWEDIYPTKSGRVKTSGYLPTTDLLGSPAGLTFGQSLYVDSAVPGRLTTTSGSNPIMKAIRSDAVEVARK